ncbi:hypothetical protein EVAR_18396_1 [Eumeta japonica]|uniref:Uncharacterized protein n=1 Tax=Eumeta variegata TaxID=151549 RepID=A0A4C1UV99_EUMVA|nr:hypothetical protein EVAR_18396_1 [Eumeta japonica]
MSSHLCFISSQTSLTLSSVRSHIFKVLNQPSVVLVSLHRKTRRDGWLTSSPKSSLELPILCPHQIRWCCPGLDREGMTLAMSIPPWGLKDTVIPEGVVTGTDSSSRTPGSGARVPLRKPGRTGFVRVDTVF